MKILLTNDDGIHAPGIRRLHTILRELGHSVVVIAPATEKSGVSHAFTFLQPLMITEVVDGAFDGLAVHGTPADCVKLGLANICPEAQMVISGVNLGHNAGPAIFYSGTVAGAAEGALAGVASLAISLDSRDPQKFTVIEKPLRHVLVHLLPSTHPGVLYNINLPAGDIKGVMLTRQSRAVFTDGYEKRRNPRGRTYFWLGTGALSPEVQEPDTGFPSDVWALQQGYVTITPLQFDMTHYQMLEQLKQEAQEELFHQR